MSHNTDIHLLLFNAQQGPESDGQGNPNVHASLRATLVSALRNENARTISVRNVTVTSS